MNTQTSILHSSIHVSKTQRIMLNILKKNIYTSKRQNIIVFCIFYAVLFNVFTRKKRGIPSFSFQVKYSIRLLQLVPLQQDLFLHLLETVQGKLLH